MLNLPDDLLGIEILHQEDEVLGNGGPIERFPIQIHVRIGTRRTLTKHRNENLEMVRVNQRIGVMDHPNHPDPAGDVPTQIIETVDDGIPVPPEVTRKPQPLSERPKQILFPKKIPSPKVNHPPTPTLQPLNLPKDHLRPFHPENHPGLPTPTHIKRNHRYPTPTIRIPSSPLKPVQFISL